ncbi:MAG: trehalose-phosphatase [Planctomyces sp.]|nr:trehalose-phosphatase [Planctomyces sp.]
MNYSELQAAILDMDGVITQTAIVHARVWKQMFDDYLLRRQEQTGESQEPFDINPDYRRYVDGKPRYDGVRSFLDARGIEIPDGDFEDSSEHETVCGLGNRKNQLFHETLQTDGVAVWDDTIEQIGRWKRAGWKVAVFSSSRNCEAVLRAADVFDLFDAKVDGNDLERLKMAGKPAPDMLQHASELLDIEPSQVIVLEDAIAGVQAARAGRFGWVVGVARDRNPTDLRNAGADYVVHDVRELETARYCPPGEDCLQFPLSALQHVDWIVRQIRQRELALFLDYDGTLTPIVRRPEDATLSAEMRSLLREIAEHCTVAIVSGRDRQNVADTVQVENLIYAGSHGYDIRGPDIQMQHEAAKQAIPELDAAEETLRNRIEPIDGAHVERKLFAIAIHYREVESETDVRRIEQTVDEVCDRNPNLRKKGGKRIFEVQPDVEWDKGRAVIWLSEALGLNPAGVVHIYIGDDVTDEDAFEAVRSRGIGIGMRVDQPTSDTAAIYVLRDCREVQHFLETLRAAIA